MTPLGFLQQLWQDKPEDHHILIWSLPEKRSRWFREIPAAAEFIANANGSDVYVGVGLSKRDHGPTRRCISEEISGLAGFWSDLDLHSEAHNQKALPSSIEEALTVIPKGMPPTMVIATGNGAHAWWLFKEPIVFETSEERGAAARLAARWNTLLRLNAAARGWAFDRLSDLARVLRIPGTINHKDRERPKQVVVHTASDRRYTLSDFEQLLDEAAVPDPEAHSRAAREWTEQFQDSPLVINLSAQVPQELLNGWMAQDLRFRNTWFRQRHDLKDQSQSGYDLALADFGTEAGLTPQQIVDLIIHHRALHRQKQRTRQDYFERTLARAAEHCDGAATLPPLPEAPAAVAPEPSGSDPDKDAQAEPPDTSEPSVDPLAAKAALCEYISEVLGVRILRIVKITGKEPTYQIVLENSKIEVNNVGKLLDQNSVRMAIATATNKLTHRLKPKLWDRLAQSILDALIELEGGPETQLEGVVRMYLEQYLSDVAFIPAIDGQPSNAIRRPMLIEGQIAINSADLQLFVNKTFVQSLSVKAMASMLAAIGAKNIRVRGSKGREQGRWMLPVTEFDPADFVEKFQREERES
jgi:hypothetical protein